MPWHSFEDTKVTGTKVVIDQEKNTSRNIKDTYKRELQRQMLSNSTKPLPSNESDQLNMIVRQNMENEEKNNQIKRNKEMDMVYSSLLEVQRRKDETSQKKKSENEKENEALEQMRRRTLEEKQAQKMQKDKIKEEAIVDINFKEEQRRREKALRQLQDLKTEAERKQIVNELNNRNKEYYDNIKKRYLRNDEFLHKYENLYASGHVSQLGDKSIVTPNENLSENGNHQTDLTDIKKVLTDQIKTNSLRKNTQLYNEVLEDYELLLKELEKASVSECQQKLLRKTQKEELLKALQQQIEEKQKCKDNLSYLNRHEYRVNKGMFAPSDQEAIDEEMRHSIPGYKLPYERVHQLDILQNSALQNTSNVLKTTNLIEKIGKTSVIDGKKTAFKPVSLESSSLVPSLPKENSKSPSNISAYESIRRRGRTSVIIESNAVNPWN